MVRSLEYGGNRRARALLSARYRRIANLDIATATLPLFAGNDQYEVVSSEVTDTRLYIKIVNHKLETAVVPGDYVQAGVVITNFEVTVTGIGYYTGTIEKTFVINKADQKIKVGGYVMTITAGGTTYISATSTSGYVSYSSSDDNVATVDNEGIVTGVGPERP
ncbi:MAG: Ig-like domain-containing protein [Lachnospiraceae bacterium]|nr:Ig-like domain-containing protein [Lachnospiraceae bacterium]